MNTSFINKNWLIKTFTDKLDMGDTNPIVMECVRDENRLLVVTPIFKNGFLIEVIETEMTVKQDKQSFSFSFPRSIQDTKTKTKNLFYRGKENLENFFYDIGILGGDLETYLGRDEDGNEIWEISETEEWRRII